MVLLSLVIGVLLMNFLWLFKVLMVFNRVKRMKNSNKGLVFVKGMLVLILNWVNVFFLVRVLLRMEVYLLLY